MMPGSVLLLAMQLPRILLLHVTKVHDASNGYQCSCVMKMIVANAIHLIAPQRICVSALCLQPSQRPVAVHIGILEQGPGSCN